MGKLKMPSVEVTGIAWQAICFKCSFWLVSDNLKWLNESVDKHIEKRNHRIEIIPANYETIVYDEKHAK